MTAGFLHPGPGPRPQPKAHKVKAHVLGTQSRSGSFNFQGRARPSLLTQIDSVRTKQALSSLAQFSARSSIQNDTHQTAWQIRSNVRAGRIRGRYAWGRRLIPSYARICMAETRGPILERPLHVTSKQDEIDKRGVPSSECLSFIL